jgi:hypothetical protein
VLGLLYRENIRKFKQWFAGRTREFQFFFKKKKMEKKKNRKQNATKQKQKSRNEKEAKIQLSSGELNPGLQRLLEPESGLGDKLAY